MGIAAPPSQPSCPYLSPPKTVSSTPGRPNSPTSMSQGFHHGIFGFSDGFDRSTSQEQHQQHIAQQSRRDKLRVQGFEPGGHSLVPIEEQGEEPSIYDSTAAAAGASNMLSEMFNFPSSDLLAGQIYRQTTRPGPMAGFSGDWYGANRQGVVLGGTNNLSSLGDSTVKHHHDRSQQQHPISGLNADSAAAMQLFLMNPTLQPPPPPQQQHHRSPSPPPPAPPPTLHHHHHHQQQAFQSFNDASFSGGMVESQRLSLSLSSSLQQFEMPKAEELRIRDGVLYFNNQAQQQQHHPSSQHLQGHGHGQAAHIEYGPMGVVNVLRNSKYARPAQELLEEFCSVGRSQLKGNRIGRHPGSSSNPNLKPIHGGGGGASSSTAAARSSSTSKDLHPLSPADRFEYQRKKAKLISMLDECNRESVKNSGKLAGFFFLNGKRRPAGKWGWSLQVQTRWLS